MKSNLLVTALFFALLLAFTNSKAMKEKYLSSFVQTQVKTQNKLKCSHGLEDINIMEHNPSDHPVSELLQMKDNKPWTPIKIFLDYNEFRQAISKGQITQKQFDSVKNVLDKAVLVYQKILKVQRIFNKITLNPYQIYGCNWSDDVKKNGVEADLIICVKTIFKEGVLANAGSYDVDKTSQRPIIGILGWNPANVKNIKNEDKGMLSTAIHEIAHILAFSSSLFPRFVDANFKKLPIDKILRKNAKGRQMIVTPKVLAAAKKHFNCNKIEGLEIENEGGDGTANSHWEERLMFGDFMIGEGSTETSISEISLALFEDSGWYQANYFTGGLFLFGKNKGCEIVEEQCIQNQKTKFTNEYCTVSGESGCSDNKRFKMVCFMANKLVDSVPAEERYFGVTSNSAGQRIALGGVQQFSDNCPIPTHNGDDPTDEYKHSCIFGSKDDDKNSISAYETYGENSGCFLSDIMPNDVRAKWNFGWKKKSPLNSACYNYKCNSITKVIELQLLGKTYGCPSRGGVMNIKEQNFNGNVVCPDYYFLCNQTKKCNDILSCVLAESMREESSVIINNTFDSNMASNLPATFTTVSPNSSNTVNPTTPSTPSTSSTGPAYTNTNSNPTPQTNTINKNGNAQKKPYETFPSRDTQGNKYSPSVVQVKCLELYGILDINNLVDCYKYFGYAI